MKVCRIVFSVCLPSVLSGMTVRVNWKCDGRWSGGFAGGSGRRWCLKLPCAIVPERGESAGSVVIAGGGIAGCAAAKALSLVGIPSIVLEREPNLRAEGTSLGLWANAWKVLDVLGVADELRDKYPKCDRVEIRQENGSVLKSFSFQECLSPAKEFRGVRRTDLLRVLVDSLPPDTIQYDVKVLGVDSSLEYPVVHTSQGDIQSPLIVGCDGASSPIARDLGLSSPNYVGYCAIRGVADIPSDFPLPLSTIFNYWGNGIRWGLYGVGKDQLYWFVTFSSPRAYSRDEKYNVKAKALSLASGFDSVVEMFVTATPEDRMYLGGLRDRWMFPGLPVGKGHITLCGDAMHPMTPNLGQGGCLALEDCISLAQKLKGASPIIENHAKLPRLLREYESERMKRVSPLVLQSNIRGALLQIGSPPVVTARNYYVQNLLSADNFLGPADFNCGVL